MRLSSSIIRNIVAQSSCFNVSWFTVRKGLAWFIYYFEQINSIEYQPGKGLSFSSPCGQGVFHFFVIGPPISTFNIRYTQGV